MISPWEVGMAPLSTVDSPNIMSSSSIDSLMENDGRIDTLPLFNRIAPNTFVCWNPVGLSPTTRITAVADWPTQQSPIHRFTDHQLGFFQKHTAITRRRKNSTTCDDRHTAIF